MLWLASLIGLAGAGAASLVMPQTQADEDEPHPNDDLSLHQDEFEGAGDLLAFDDVEMDEDDAEPFYLHEDFMTQEATPLAAESGATTAGLDEGYEDLFATDYDEDDTPSDLDTAQAAPVVLGEWVMEGPPAEFIDYEAETESLMLVWDDLAEDANEPEVRVEHDPDDADVKHVVMNDYSVAEVHGDPELSAEDVTVIPLSSALIVGLEPA